MRENCLFKTILVALGLLISFTLGALLKPSEVLESRESNLYAEMVCLGIETDMAYGWPNYKGLSVDCN